MEVILAKGAGFCFGVKRAVDEVYRRSREKDGPIYTYGPITHNDQVVKDLEDRGVRIVRSPEEAASLAEGTLIIRSHGIGRAEEDALRSTTLKVIDMTCPYVKKVHRAVERLDAEGYQVVIVGEEGHPEVEGTRGHAPSALVVGSADDVSHAELGRRVGVVVQTTMAKAVLDEVVCALTARAEEVRVLNTICDATSKRQQAATELAARADVMVIVGGKNSANTTHLADICRAACAATHHIETPDELDASWFEGVGLVGVTAGASTPQAHIAAVCTALESLS